LVQSFTAESFQHVWLAVATASSFCLKSARNLGGEKQRPLFEVAPLASQQEHISNLIRGLEKRFVEASHNFGDLRLIIGQTLSCAF
jgi:hypothetical protein